MTNKNEQSLELIENNNTTTTSTTTTTTIDSPPTSVEKSRSDSESIDQNDPKVQLFNYAIQFDKGSFKPEKHYYPQTLNSSIHPIVKSFFEMNTNMIASRYVQINPLVNIDALKQCLNYKPKYFKWAGSDLFNVTNNLGKRQMIIVESNSCPSGQKSMPLIDNTNIYGGYKTILQECFKELINTNNNNNSDVKGDLAVIYDQNQMESGGFCSVLAEITNEKVWFATYFEDETEQETGAVKWSSDGQMFIRDELNVWHPIRACLRFVTQRPWKRLPLRTKTKIINPIIVCLAGGRNKIMAVHAYKSLNDELANTGLKIRTPKTIVNLNKNEIKECIEKMGGRGVIKVPYGNCGDGVYTITSEKELNRFLEHDHYYEKFLVQSLVGDRTWWTNNNQNNNNNKDVDDNYYHIGTIPNGNNEIFVFDLRMVVTSNDNGFCPVSINGRRARKPIVKDNLENNVNSWDMLGTNLSVKVDTKTWCSESKRVLLMDFEEFSQLGIGLDDLIDGFIQTILSIIAIDKFCDKLLLSDDKINFELFKSLNSDKKLLEEI